MATRKKRASTGERKARAPRQAASLTLSDLNQAKVLADPLRLRILEELCTAERTTKQVAQRLGEKPTKLYHHVQALERVGLIRLARTRQNRGTIEKYYLAVAKQIRADSRLFAAADATAPDKEDSLRAMISTVFERTSDEMRGLIAQGRGRKGVEEQGLLSYLEVRTDARQGRQLLARLARLVKSLEGGKEKPGSKKYRLTLAFYPLDPES
jgi:DNA-binding transcriptional ArsR family regulator